MYFLNVFHKMYLYDLSYNKTLYALIMAHIQMQSNQSPLPIVPYPSTIIHCGSKQDWAISTNFFFHIKQ